MAYLDATDWLDIQANDSPVNEKRFAPLGVVDAVADSTPAIDYLSPSTIQKMKTLSSLRNVQNLALKDQTVTVVTTPGFGYIPSNLPESAEYTFTAVDVFSGFRHYPAQFANNAMDEAWTKRQVMRNVAYAMGQQVESLLLTTLSNRKTQVLSYTTQVSQGDGTYSFDSGTDKLTISKAAQKETMFFQLGYLLEANDLPGNYRVVTSRGGLAVQKSEMAKYGLANDKNLQALGFYSPDRMYESSSISTSANFDGYLLRDGAIGMIENFPYDFASGTSFAGKTWSITDMELPYCRMKANIYVNNEATNATALVGAGTDSNMTMTHFQEMAIWLRFYIPYRYNSSLSTRANDIVYLIGATS